MISAYPIIQLKGHVKQVSIRNKDESKFEVYSVTNSEGFTKSSDYFSKEVFSKNLSNYKVVKVNQFAYNPSRINVGSIDYLKISDKVIVSPLYIIFDVSPEINPDYLLRYLHSNWGNIQIRSNTEGAVRNSLKFKGLENIKVPLPKLNDQIRIAHLLQQVEKLVTQRKHLLQQLDKLLKGVFLDMFFITTGNYKQWSIEPLSIHSEIVSGVTKGKKYKDEERFDTPYMRVANVQDGHFKLDEIKTISVSNNEIQKYLLQIDDLLLTEGGDPDKLGRGSVWEGQIENCIHQNHIFRVRVKDKNKINPRYLSGLVGSKYGKAYFLKSAKQTTGIASINSTQLKKFPTIIPPIDLQNKYVFISEKIESIKKAYQKNLTDLEELYASLSQQAFRGELDLSNINIDNDIAIVDDENDDEFEQAELEHEQDMKISNQIAWGEEYPMSSINGRARLIRAYFDGYMSLPDAKDFSIDAFFEYANFKVLDYMDEDDKPFGFNEYELVKGWLFENINNNKVEQSFVDEINQIQLKAKG